MLQGSRYRAFWSVLRGRFAAPQDGERRQKTIPSKRDALQAPPVVDGLEAFGRASRTIEPRERLVGRAGAGL
jgi:hypothetical protein